MSTSLVRLRTDRARRAIYEVCPDRVDQYARYWLTLAPRTHRQYYWQWVFAFLSIRTRWETNVALFRAVRSLPFAFSRRQVRGVMDRLRGGLIEMRVEGLTRFRREFWASPKHWYVQSGESFPDARDRLCGMTHGLGLAKTSFVLEMAYPVDCKVVCIDTHVKQVYGLGAEDGIPAGLYRRIEKHWIRTCEERGLASPQVRNVWWDLLRGENSTRYWSHVLER